MDVTATTHVTFIENTKKFVTNALNGEVDPELGRQIVQKSARILDRWERFGRGFAEMISPEACQAFDDFLGAEMNTQIRLWDSLLKSKDIDFDGK